MPEITKYDILVKDLETIETRVSILKHNYEDVSQRNKELEEIVASSQKENIALHRKIENLQEELKKIKIDTENNGINSLNLEERETLKIKLQDLIKRIDYHLSADLPR